MALGIGLGLGLRGEATGDPAPSVRKVVFALMGQSNMTGRATPPPDVPDYPAGVYQYTQAGALLPATDPLDHIRPNPGTTGIALQFALDYMAANPSHEMILVPLGEGGSSFAAGDWNPGDPNHATAVSQVNGALAAVPGAELGAFLWCQGEGDALDAASVAAWPAAMQAMIDSLRSDVLGADPTTPFVCLEIPLQTGLYGEIVSHTNAVPERTAYTSVVDWSDATLFDGLHADYASVRTAGGRVVAAIAAARANAPRAPEAPVLAAAAGDGEVALTLTPGFDGHSPLSGFETEASMDGTSGWTLVAAGPDLAFSETGLPNGTERFYRARAFNSLGASPPSSVVAATPAAAAPSVAEAGALAHWLLGTDNPVDADLISGRTLVSSAGVTRQADHLAYAPGGLVHSATGLAETPAMTVAGVFRTSSSNPANQVLFGNLNEGGPGSAIFVTGSGIRFNLAGTGGQDWSPAEPRRDDVWLFLAYAIDAAGAAVFYIGDPAEPRVRAVSGTRGINASASLAIGNIDFSFTGFDAGSFDCAEFIVWDTALSAAALGAVHGRSRTRLTDRGLSIV